MIYFDNLTSTAVCPEIQAARTHDVADHKPASVVVYDYYETGKCLWIKGDVGLY